QRAKALANRLVQGLGAQDSAVVLPLLSPEEAASTPVSLSGDRSAIEEQLAALQPSHATVDLPGAIQHAFTLLQESPMSRRRLVFLSDLTMHGWEDFHLSRLAVVPEHVTVHFIRLGGPQRDANVLISDVRITEKPFVEHTPLDVTAVVQNRSATALHNV